MSNEEIKTARSYIGRLMDEYATAREAEEADSTSTKMEFNTDRKVRNGEKEVFHLSDLNGTIESLDEIQDTSMYEEMRQMYPSQTLSTRKEIIGLVDKAIQSTDELKDWIPSPKVGAFNIQEVILFKLEERYRIAFLSSKTIEHFESKVSEIKQQTLEELSEYLRETGMDENEIASLSNEMIDVTINKENNKLKEESIEKEPSTVSTDEVFSAIEESVAWKKEQQVTLDLRKELDLPDDLREVLNMEIKEISKQNRFHQHQVKHDIAKTKRRKANKLASKQRRKKK